MPPAVAVAGVTAAGALGGAFMQNKAASNAARAQAKSSADMMALERERDSRRSMMEDRQWDDYQRRITAHEEGRKAIMRKYGVNVDGGAGGLTGRVPGRGMAPTGDGGAMLNLGALAGAPVAAGSPPLGSMGGDVVAAPEEEAVEDMGADWNDWGRHGLR
jgi:hypothetical protein